MANVRDFARRVIENIEHVIVGKRTAIEMAVIGLLSQGHLLIEDVPGVGKTMLARSLARSLSCSFGRIQFTPCSTRKHARFPSSRDRSWHRSC